MADTHYQVDLSTCDFEPIHILGRIQSFGYLLSVSSDWIINHASRNTSELFGKDAETVIGTPVGDYLSGSSLRDIRWHAQMLGPTDLVERIFEVDLVDDGRRFDVAMHRSGRSIVLEFEPNETGRRRDYISYVRPMVDRMRRIRSIGKLCESAARQLRALTGFDRVMIYRFDSTGAGEVVAESRNGEVPSYKGLHFPASDIPAQARRLYARNILRIIADVNDPTVEIVPVVDPGGTPLDLSMSGLRAVSPIHIEYLKNMGVEASMSVSIMNQGKLWGLMACHNYEPLQLPYSVRTAAELFGEFFSYLLEEKEGQLLLNHREGAMRLHDEIMTRVASGGPWLSAFEEFADSISRVIPFDGIVGWVDGDFMSRGDTPTREQFAELSGFLDTAGAGAIWSTDNLARAFPPAQAYAMRCAGVLALPVSRTPRDYIVLFRKEYVQEVNWAGDPDKPVELGPNGARLTPRKSFEIWKEERRGRSRPWEPEEIASAESLRVTLLEVVLRFTEAASEERERASEQQDTLIAELNHRVRNILNLIRGLVSQSRAGSQSIEDYSRIVGDRIYALARAHDQVTQANWSPASLHQLVQTEFEAYAFANQDRIVLDGPDAMITPTAFSTLALVVHELTTNSCKYGALSDSRGKVTVRLETQDDQSLAIDWRESGGPAVEPPKRRGFGSAIIERTIPHELGGEAEVDYEPEGLHARFVIPSDCIASYQAGIPEQAREADADQVVNMVLSGPALIVEDNVIIAMEAEDILQDLGFGQCRVCGSVDTALELMGEHAFAFAMLDFNLGAQSSEPIAAALQDRDIPFVFASGYGDSASRSEAFRSVPMITKPFTASDVRDALRKLGIA